MEIGRGGYALSSRGRKLQRSQPANRLERNSKQFAPVTWMPPTELPGKRKTAGQPKNKLVCFSGLPGGFSLCALRTAGPALLARPEAEDSTSVSVCICCFHGGKRGFSASLFMSRGKASYC